jgi:hypothetical protein
VKKLLGSVRKRFITLWWPLYQSASPFLLKISSKIPFFGGLDPVSSLAKMLYDSMILPLTFDMLPLEK